MTGTRDKLLAAAAACLREDGVAAASARTIAARAGVNQALIFYHFGAVDEVLAAASRQAVEVSIAGYADRFAAVTSLHELLALGRELHERERAAGNVAMMAQLMSAAPRRPVLAAAAAEAMSAWTEQVEGVLRRVLRGSPVTEVTDVGGLARATSAGFIGLELYDGVAPERAAAALEALDGLGTLLQVLDDLGPVTRRAVRARVRRSRRA